jgi:hypothetical protein
MTAYCVLFDIAKYKKHTQHPSVRCVDKNDAIFGFKLLHFKLNLYQNPLNLWILELIEEGILRLKYTPPQFIEHKKTTFRLLEVLCMSLLHFVILIISLIKKPYFVNTTHCIIDP